MDPGEFVTFNLRYEELLVRKEHKYNYEINIQPKNEAISSIKIQVIVNESLPLESVSVKRIRQSIDSKEKKEEEITQNSFLNEKVNPYFANITDIFPPSNDGKYWKFVVQYDVKRPNDGNEIQIGAGRFIHYFVPDPENISRTPKHVIFVIDISESMNGRKLEQTTDAMLDWLEKLEKFHIECFNIILFDYSVTNWRGK